MRTLIFCIMTVVVIGCAKAPPPEVFSYNEDIKSVVMITTELGGHGTGFYIGDGLIMTAKHVTPADGLVYYYIDRDSNELHNLELVFRSKELDVAILRTRHEHNLLPVVFAEKDAQIGERITNISFPEICGWVFAQGYVMNHKAEWIGEYKRKLEDFFKGGFFMYSISLGKGSSGSPIWNEQGHVVGMVNAMLTEGGILWGHTVTALKQALEEFNEQNKNSASP